MIGYASDPAEVSDRQLRLDEWATRQEGLAAEPNLTGAFRASQAAFEAFDLRGNFGWGEIDRRSTAAIAALDAAILSLEGEISV